MGRPRSCSPRDPLPCQLPSAPLPSPFLSPFKKETPTPVTWLLLRFPWASAAGRGRGGYLASSLAISCT